MIRKRLADLVARPVEQAAEAARAVSRTVTQTVGDRLGGLASRSADALEGRLPDAPTVRRGFADALVFGGKLLYDPRATVGELAIGLGQGLRPASVEDTWLLLRAAGEGFEVIGRGSEHEMRIAFEQARDSGAVLLCQARAASDPPAADPAAGQAAARDRR